MAKKTNFKEYKFTKVYCPNCGKQLYKEVNKTSDNYPFVCKSCNENFFNFETSHK